jgi:hypothetical protein
MDEIELYAFSSDRTTSRWTPHDVDVLIGADRYTSLPLQRTPLTVGADGGKATLELTVPPECALARQLLEAASAGDMTVVRLFIADRRSGSWAIRGVRWLGRVLGVEVGESTTRIRCESAQVSLKRIGLRRLYSRACSHVLYSQACGATPIQAGMQVANVHGRTVTFTAPLPPGVAGTLAGGWLETGAGARHMIVAEQASSVELLQPATLAPGTAVTVVAGCDHSTASCAGRFNNLDNYGGFPFIPQKNPFATGVF